MPSTPTKLLMGIYFYPRGGSAHVCRAIAREFERNEFEVTVLSGSRSDHGEHALAPSFYSGLDLRPVDFTPALLSADRLRFEGGAGTAPMHGSYEDRLGAEDPILASLDDERLRAPGRRLEPRAGPGRSRRRGPPLPAPSDPAQRGGGAGLSRSAGDRPRPRHRAADAGTDRRRRAGELDRRRGLGRADPRLGRALRADRRQQRRRPRARQRRARPRPRSLRLRPQRLRFQLRPAPGRPPRPLAPASGRAAAGLAAGVGRRAASPTRTRSWSRWTGRFCSTPAASPRSSACRCCSRPTPGPVPASSSRPPSSCSAAIPASGRGSTRSRRSSGSGSTTSSSPAGIPTPSCPTSSTPPTCSSTPRSRSSSVRSWSRRWPAPCP